MQLNDPVDTIGNTAGSVGGGVNDVTGPVNGHVNDAAGGADITAAGDAGGAAGSGDAELAVRDGSAPEESSDCSYHSELCAHACRFALAVRMLVTWLTQGKRIPPVWMQMWMYYATYAIMMATMIVVLIPLFTGEMIGVDRKFGDLSPAVHAR